MTKTKVKRVVLYHGGCDDGFGSAWAARKKFGSDAKYIGIFHSDPFPEAVVDADVYMLDICYPPKVIKKLLRVAGSLTVIDHHISSKEAIKLVPEHIFDPKNHSGAVLSWKYFHPKKAVPKLLEYIEDGDLWKWRLPQSKEFTASLRSYEQSFKTWDKIARDLESAKTRKKYFEEGRIILASDQDHIKHAADAAILVEFCGHKALASNSFHFTSQVGHALYKKHPPFSIIWSYKPHYIKVSLRSNGKMDVSKLAEKFGGGGHRASAGFELKFGSKLPWKIVGKSPLKS